MLNLNLTCHLALASEDAFGKKLKKRFKKASTIKIKQSNSEGIEYE